MISSFQSVLFYNIEKAIKTYRQFAQKELKKNGLEITVDQWLVLRSIAEEPKISQKQLAIQVFKDAASITRIIDLLEKAAFIKRKTHAGDKRRSSIEITVTGKSILSKTEKVVLKYRKKALENIKKEDIALCQKILNKITDNCK